MPYKYIERLALVALAVIALALASGGAGGHELKAEVLRESDLLRFPTARRLTDSERNTIEAQACNRAKFAAENQLIRTRHNRALRFSDCACSTTSRIGVTQGRPPTFRRWAECRVEAFGQDRR